MFTSYAQNFEDVILWRALKDIKDGLYIDIGAQHPTHDSVSRSFYENGWRGIHAEPTAYYSNLIRKNRPDEEVLQVAIGDGEGSISFYEIPDTGLSSGDREIAAAHQTAGHTVYETQVEIIPLSRVFEHTQGREIHWLKIDVEGMEASVIRSWAPSTARPRIVVVEATKPNSQIPTHHEWENILLGYGYIFAYFDGLSRFYVSENHQHLLNYFGPGPNFFDGFRLTDTSAFVDKTGRDNALKIVESLEIEKLQLVSELNAFRIALNATNEHLSSAEERLGIESGLRAQTEAELHALINSRSWRLTAPLRHSSYFVNYMRQGISAWIRQKPGSRPRRTAHLIILHAILWLKRRPHIAAPLLGILRRFPVAHQYVHRLHLQAYALPSMPQLHPQQTLLSPRAQAILADINNEIDRPK